MGATYFNNRRAVAALLTISSFISIPRDLWGASENRVVSAYTSLKPDACTKRVDKDDANQLSYLICKGVAGYALQVREVDSGRVSITVVDPARHEFPLGYEDFVTRAMTHLDDKAEWRVRLQGGKRTPVALLVRVMAHEKPGDPEAVTGAYWAVAKITPRSLCVTDSVPEGLMSETKLLQLADSAASRPCAQELPESEN